MTHVELLLDCYVLCDLLGGSNSRDFCGGNDGDGVIKIPSGGIIWGWDKVR